MRSAAILAFGAPTPSSHNWETWGLEWTCFGCIDDEDSLFQS